MKTMTVQEKIKQGATTMQAMLRVEVRGRHTTLHLVPDSGHGTHSVRMGTRVWREFCRRQLACPPPLPGSF